MTDMAVAAREALQQVDDPEIGINIVDLGLVYDITEEADGSIRVLMTLTTEACPVGPRILSQVEAAIANLPGHPLPDVHLTFDPPWTPDMITPDGRALLGW